MRNTKKMLLISAALMLIASFSIWHSANSQQPSANSQQPSANSQQPSAANDDAAVARTRKQVKMLDSLYKSAIVLITENYVTEKSDLPAGAAFKKLFQSMKDNGWHEVRLLDATGNPYEPANAAKSDFEKSAIKQIVEGKPYVDQVIQKDGKRFLLAATAIPVVMKKCIMCHENYGQVPEGKAIGALGYTVPIE